MKLICVGLFAADAVTRIRYELVRLHSMTEWWHWLMLAVISACVLAYVAAMYFHDSRELPRGLRWLLLLLRVFAFAGLLFVFFDLEKRTEREVIKNSRALLLVDTSQSMALQDADSSSLPGGPSRIDRVISKLEKSSLIRDLRAKHDLVVMRFDQAEEPIEVGSFPKLQIFNQPKQLRMKMMARRKAKLHEARYFTMAAFAIFLIAIVAMVVYLISRAKSVREKHSWMLLVSILAIFVGLVTLAVGNLRHPEILLKVVLGLKPAELYTNAQESPPADSPNVQQQEQELTVDWKEKLLPRGAETRLGTSLVSLINKQRGEPIAAIVVFSDGRNNAGVDYTEAIEAAQDANIPVYTVGLGSAKPPVNVRVVDLEAPARVYPGDYFTVTGFIQAYGLEGRSMKAELFSADAQGNGQPEAATLQEQRFLQLGASGDVQPVKFEISPPETGVRVYTLRVSALKEEYDARDNEQSARVQIVERQNRVLLLAGGPTREFRFLRNQLYRDKETLVDVLLQTGQPGISQEADNVLYDFPDNETELFGSTSVTGGKSQPGYDCIVAFDPDWRKLEDHQIQLLERWVAEQAGGLIVIAGPVHTPQWAARRRGELGIDTIKDLYPVVFFSRGTSLGLGNFGAEIASPLHFTRDGQEATFLWLDDTATKSQRIWAGFEGVFGYYAVRDIKPGATIYAKFTDDQSENVEDLPVYIAGHFYGAGRVVFMASGEIWRIRAMDDSYFEQFYTKLIRYVSQGRLLRDSSRGVLIVGKQRCLLGDTVAIKATLTDPQHRSLTAPSVSLDLVQPDGTRKTIVLRKVNNSVRDGMYAGQFTALMQGNYRLELAVPGSGESEMLRREVRVRVPDREIQHPQRNDALLKDLAERTSGRYYVGMDAVMGRGVAPLAKQIEPQDRPTPLPDLPDKDFDQRMKTWLMITICGVLSLEWLIRRLTKLA